MKLLILVDNLKFYIIIMMIFGHAYVKMQIRFLFFKSICTVICLFLSTPFKKYKFGLIVYTNINFVNCLKAQLTQLFANFQLFATFEKIIFGQQ